MLVCILTVGDTCISLMLKVHIVMWYGEAAGVFCRKQGVKLCFIWAENSELVSIWAPWPKYSLLLKYKKFFTEMINLYVN